MRKLAIIAADARTAAALPGVRPSKEEAPLKEDSKLSTLELSTLAWYLEGEKFRSQAMSPTTWPLLMSVLMSALAEKAMGGFGMWAARTGPGAGD